MRLVGWRTNLDQPLREPRRIVSVGPSNTEILHALGLGRRIVGVDRWSDYPPRVARLPRVGSDLRVDVSAILTLQPDIVVASLHVPGMEHNLIALEEAGLPYVALGGEGLEGVWQDMRTIGHWLGRSGRASRLIAGTVARMASIEGRYAAAKERPRVHWEWSSHPIVAGRRSWITELLQLAGGENAYADMDVESVQVSVEDAIARNPDVVVACWCGYRKLPTEERIRARYGRNGRVAVYAEDLFGRPGPRLADGLERLARLLHPEL